MDTQNQTATALQTPSPAASVPSAVSDKPNLPLPTPAEAERILHQAAEKSQAIYAGRGAKRLGTEVVAAASHVRRISPEEAERQAARQAEAERAEAVARCFEQCRVPDLYRRAKLEDFARIPADSRERYAHEAAQLLQAERAPGIYALIGEIGAGKTFMACALVNAFCRSGRSARYVKAADYVEGLRATWKSDQAEAESRYRRPFETVKLLVIDEWQVRRGTDDENLHLLRLIDRRYEAGGTTVIISNHASEDEFGASIDARVADRIQDGGGVIVCDWQSLRGRLEA